MSVPRSDGPIPTPPEKRDEVMAEARKWYGVRGPDRQLVNPWVRGLDGQKYIVTRDMFDGEPVS